jgi:uncharacterized protein YggE
MLIRSIVLAGCAAASLLAGPTAAASEDPPRTVAVAGRGEVTAQPDIAFLTLGVEARDPSMEVARKSVNDTIGRVLALCKDLGIDSNLVGATRLQVQPDYSWNEQQRKRVLEGYVVSRQVRVELRDLEKLGALIERAIDTGVNQASDPMLDSSRRKDLEREALARAVEDARLNAETLARAAGMGLGPVRHLNAGGAPPVVPMYRSAMVMADAPAPPPPPEASYQVGDMRFTASVAAEYDLLQQR